jgi:voltage-gated potassium channel
MKPENKASSINPAKITKGLFALAVILCIGTSGFMTIEGWSFLDSLYMTAITITTVGYREIAPPSAAGMIFTIFIAFSGIGILFYFLSLIAQAMFEIQVKAIIERRKLGSRMRAMKDHYIVCGFGRLGRIICRELHSNRIPMVVIENQPDLLQVLEHENTPYIIGDATNEEVLTEAGVEKARGLVSVVASDADNVFITMSAKGLNPALFVLARAEEEQTEKKLLRAGATRVVMPYRIGAQKMAHIIVKPAISDFLELTVHNRRIGLEMEELEVSEHSPLNGLTLIDSGIRQEMDVIIMAIRKREGEMKFNPSSKTRIEAGDTLIALGKSDDISKLAKVLSSSERSSIRTSS